MTSNMNALKQPPQASINQACPSCGADINNILQTLAQSFQCRISELETQVRILTGKATAAVDKLADYEDQLHQLKSTSQGPQRSPLPDPPTTPTHSREPPSRANSSTPVQTHRSPLQTRLANFLPSARRSATPPSSAPPTQLTHSQSVRQGPTQPPAHPASSSSGGGGHHHTASNPLPTDSSALDLTSALANEHALRVAAESHLSASQAEIEELSTQLFSEANEMVAVERRNLASLQAKHAQLEEEARGWERQVKEREERETRLRERLKVLEGRDGEKRFKWEELERRVGRVERVKALLADEGRRSLSVGDADGRSGSKGGG
ncbi:MAG: hypothetical protein LQ350_005891 [Teloschistes chrysophthalmus]|nr:MAG: hypothetical protein LQ350_005891 [Niorma chrysophthalma]